MIVLINAILGKIDKVFSIQLLSLSPKENVLGNVSILENGCITIMLKKAPFQKR